MEKREYTRPAVLEIEISAYNMLCTSIVISNEEFNDAGRASKQERQGWDNGLWGN